jgi:hypothetical protein
MFYFIFFKIDRYKCFTLYKPVPQNWEESGEYVFVKSGKSADLLLGIEPSASRI